MRSKHLCQINAGRIRAVFCRSSWGRRGYEHAALMVGNTQASAFNSASPWFPAYAETKTEQRVKAKADWTAGFFPTFREDHSQAPQFTAEPEPAPAFEAQEFKKHWNCLAMPRSGSVHKSPRMGSCRVRDMWRPQEGRWRLAFLTAEQVPPGQLGRNLPGLWKVSSSHLRGMFWF